jgi:endonuclease/exonuclease/phosphatase (EEP) superfamily protein YafD
MTPLALALAGRWIPRLDVFSHLAPVWGLLALACLVWGGWSRSHKRPPAIRLMQLLAGTLGIVAAAILMVPEFLRPLSPPAPANAPRQIKLIQWNVWEKNPDPIGTVNWIVAQNPDVVTLEDASQFMIEAMGRRGYTANFGISNSVVFSRLPRSPRRLQIPQDAWDKLPSFARARYLLSGQSFDVVAVHLLRPIHHDRSEMAQALFDVLNGPDLDRMIVAGDFNLTPWSSGLRHLDQMKGLERRDRAMASWPVRWPSPRSLPFPFPILAIDHVYAGKAWRTVRIERGPAMSSAHYPIIVTMALTSPEDPAAKKMP